MRVYALVIGLVLSLGVSSAAAQTGASFGVKAGVNFAKLDFSGDDDGVDFDQRMGLVAGAFVLVPMTETFGLQVEGLYSQKGAEVDSPDFGGQVVEGRFEFDWFDVPVLARYTIPSSTNTSFHLFAGPSFSFKLGAKSVFDFDGEEDEQDVDDQFKGFDLGLVIGAGVDFGKFTIDGRYTHGLTDLNDFDDFDEEIVEVKNRVFSIMAGFRF